MAYKSVSLVIIFFCILLGSRCIPSRSSASRILADDDHNKIRVGGSTPRRDGSWNGNSSPSGNILLSPPSTVVYISTAPPVAKYMTTEAGQPNTPVRTVVVVPTNPSGRP